PMKVSACTSARLTRDLITIARTIRATATTVTRTNIGGIGGTDPIIATTTIRIPVGTTIRIDRALGKARGLRFFLSDNDRRKNGLTGFRVYGQGGTAGIQCSWAVWPTGLQRIASQLTHQS